MTSTQPAPTMTKWVVSVLTTADHPQDRTPTTEGYQ